MQEPQPIMTPSLQTQLALCILFSNNARLSGRAHLTVAGTGDPVGCWRMSRSP